MLRFCGFDAEQERIAQGWNRHPLFKMWTRGRRLFNR